MGRRRFTVASSSGHHHDMIGLADDDHTQYLLVNGTRSFTGDLTPSAADQRSIGSATRELLNLYMGDAGGIYFGLAQDVFLYRVGADILGLAQDDYLYFVGSVLGNRALASMLAGDANPRFVLWNEGALFWGDGTAAVDVNLFRGAANRLDLANGDSLNLVGGNITNAAGNTVDGVDLSMYSKGYLHWHGHAAMCGGGSVNYVGSDGVDATENHTQIPVPEAATAVTLYIQILTNTVTGATTVTLRQNGVNTAITLSIPAGGTGVYSDVAHSVAFAAGDLASIIVNAGADGANNLTVGGVSVKFAQSAA